MKKTTILSVLTAAMITATSIGTFAIWDIVTVDSRSNTVTMRNPVTVSGSVKFNVANEDSVAKKLTLQESIQASEKLEETTDYSIVFSGYGVSGKTDSSVTDGTEEYNYTITFTQSGLEKMKTNANACTVKVTATLS